MSWRKKLIWTVDFDDRARKELRKLDQSVQKYILAYLRKNIAVEADPRRLGKPLSYDKHGLWRYRIQDIRIICHIDDMELLVLVVKAAHRKKVYKE